MTINSSKIEDRIDKSVNNDSLKSDEKWLEKKKDQSVNESQFESTKHMWKNPEEENMCS